MVIAIYRCPSSSLNTKSQGCTTLLHDSHITETSENFQHAIGDDSVISDVNVVPSDMPIALRKGARRDVPQPARYRDILPCPAPSLPPHDPRRSLEPPDSFEVGASKSLVQTSMSQLGQVLRSPSNIFGLVREYVGGEFPQHDPEEYIQFEDLCIRISETSSPLPPVSLGAAPPQDFFPYPNYSSFRLGDWYWNDGTQKTQATFQNLVRIIADPEFVPADILHNKWDHINAVLGENQADDDEDWVDAADEGWRVSQIKISVPFHTGATHPGARIFEGVHLYHRSLVAVMKERVSDPHYFCHFHIEPYKLLWQTHTGSGKQESCVYGEVYTSRAFLRAHTELLSSPHEAGCQLPRVICAFMFWSDATHLTSFGNTKLWPVYVYFGNESKYRRGKPSFKSCNHVAYLEKVDF